MNETYLLSVQHLSKSFPGVKALDDVHLNVEAGKVHAVMGENGAGKSTLMKILIGMIEPDSGNIYFKGERVAFHSVHDAIKAGFSMIHQELLPFPDLTVAENILMGREPVVFPGWINRKKLNMASLHLISRLGVSIKVNRKMKTLSVAETQMVEIAKAISNNAEVIIMDEPTSAISQKEVDILFGIIKDLTARGIAVIYISHKMDEVLQIADTVTVMRDGKWIATQPASGLNKEALINMIVGRPLDNIFDKKSVPPGEVLLSVKALSGDYFSDISFEVHAGEILGIAGLMGAGRTEIMRAIFGLDKIRSGFIYIKGKPVRIKSPGQAMDLGIGFISEDRKETGLVLSSTVRNNITLGALSICSNNRFIDKKKEAKIADEQIRKFNIKTPGRNQVVNYLSGGNQQKVVLAKVLLRNPEVIIFDEPTRGIDIGAKAEIYKMMTALAAAGKAIIMISSELPEVLGMSDRILVVREGKISKELKAEEATQELIMEYAMV
ncbi:MAG: sugar ABC transporter ATP-binding protein [Sphingobacteriales bacterium]|nr:sugar ABC transporter ATP-binding protein [Sphingobacteriales bacterium]OJY85528.1 MAG: D-xylose ABC transporter ATP-binding protein [Sphingobacteriales bacterium 44-15]